MRRISLKEARIGMTLEADVVNSQKMLLLKKRTILSEKNLRMLKSWGVETLSIKRPEGENADTPGVTDNDSGPEEVVASRFGNTTDNPVMAEIRRIASAIVNERTRPAR